VTTRDTSNDEVAIIDGGGANIASLRFALERLGHQAVLTTDPERIATASHVILPGVGAARNAMQRLHEHELTGFIPQLRQPFLGICLGMQLLFDSSAEENAGCLGILRGRAQRFPANPDRPVPHMGWNRIATLRTSPLLAGLADDEYFYFVHSYALPVSEDTIASSDYGGAFSAIVGRGNFHGTQFHPERSGAAGARLLANFLSL
jgi:imidazole glycerol-phosphate synthase subunit HisH